MPGIPRYSVKGTCRLAEIFSPEAAASQPNSAVVPWIGADLRFKIKGMADAYEVWMGQVQQALGSINM